MPFFDTIVAPITAVPGPVAIVRISGPESWKIAASVFKPLPVDLVPRTAYYGRFITGDDGLATFFEERKSYTGEASVELSIHGSIPSVRALVDKAIEFGARAARPGEFTERAVLNGKLDLSQAEGIRDTIAAQTEAQFKQAELHRNGALSSCLKDIEQRLLSVLAAIEAHVDFSEEIGPFNREGALLELQKARAETDRLIATALHGKLVRNGIRIAICGLPNAGKSSLLNAVLGEDRAIVTPMAGTTRDTIEASASIHGLLCILTDTAGMRDSADKIETEGVRRARLAAQSADLVWYVFDATIGWTEEDDREYKALGGTLKQKVGNKVDLPSSAALVGDAIYVSAATGSNLNLLLKSVSDLVPVVGERPFVNLRQATELSSAREGLNLAIESLSAEIPLDLTSVHIRSALLHLGHVTGSTASIDLLERVFADFCIGK